MEVNPEQRKIDIGQKTLKHLNVTRRWTMFIVIMGFIILGLIIVIGLLAGTFLSAFSTEESHSGVPAYKLLIIIIAMAVVYLLPIIFLFRFSKHTAHAVHNLDNQELHKAFRNLKYYFVYISILIIIVLILYIGALIVSGTSLAFLKGLS
jgi:small-conductance mechanosensitive channel